jgi:hypothetical protein
LFDSAQGKLRVFLPLELEGLKFESPRARVLGFNERYAFVAAPISQRAVASQNTAIRQLSDRGYS